MPPVILFFRKMMKFVLVMVNYAKNCASTICQSLCQAAKKRAFMFTPPKDELFKKILNVFDMKLTDVKKSTSSRRLPEL